MIHSEMKLYLVFEFLDQDLKKYMDTFADHKKTDGGPKTRIQLSLVKVLAGKKQHIVVLH